MPKCIDCDELREDDCNWHKATLSEEVIKQNMKKGLVCDGFKRET